MLRGARGTLAVPGTREGERGRGMCEDCFGTLNGCTYGASSQKQLTAFFVSHQEDALHLPQAGRDETCCLVSASAVPISPLVL